MEQCVSHITDESLARSAVQGDGRAFDEVVRRYCKPLADFAASRTATFQDAEDIAQETFLRAWRHLSSYDEAYPLRSWLFTIAYRLIVTGYRKKKPVRLSTEVAERLEAQSPSRGSEHEWLWQTAANLPADDYSILWLRYKQEMTIPDIARIVNKTKITVRVRLHRARCKLAELIRQSKDTSGQWAVPDVVDVKGVD